LLYHFTKGGVIYMANGERGRPTIYSELKAEAICEAIRQGNYIETAAALVGIDKRTIFNWRSRGEKGEEPFNSFFSRVESAMAEAEANAVQNIIEAGRESWQANAWYLERRNAAQWGRKDRLMAEVNSQHTERTEAVIEHQIASDPETVELLKQLYKRQQVTANAHQD
jgi:transposase-like protein